MDGAAALASLKRLRTRPAPTPKAADFPVPNIFVLIKKFKEKISKPLQKMMIYVYIL